jgi:hypothetical protein
LIKSSKPQSYVTTECQSASLSWCETVSEAPRPDFCCQTVAGLFMWDALSDERRVCRVQLLLVLAIAVIFTAVKISSICHLCLQFYMSAFYTVICHESGSLWTLNIYVLHVKKR